VFQQVRQRLSDLAERLAQSMGCRAETRFVPTYPPVINDDRAANFAMEIAQQAVGEQRFLRLDTAYMPSEDFAFYGKAVPSCFSFIGVCPPDRDSYPPLHSPQFDFTDAAIAVGARLMCEYALNANRLAA
jgi:hippurate hydrolase